MKNVAILEANGWPDAGSTLSFAAVQFRILLLKEREDERRRTAMQDISIAVRAGGADQENWVSWTKRMEMGP